MMVVEMEWVWDPDLDALEGACLTLPDPHVIEVRL